MRTTEIDFEKNTQEFDGIYTAYTFERRQNMEDRRFVGVAGAQWEGNLARQFEHKPMFEFDKISMAITRIENEYRNNRIAVRFVSEDDGDPDLPDVAQSLFRADEQDSSADEAYDNAFSELIAGGIGAYRLTAKYEDEVDDENEEQRIRFEPIFDADVSVWWDLNAKRFDKADASVCFLLKSITLEAFKEQFPRKKVVASMQRDSSGGNAGFDWYGPDVIYVAECYQVEYVEDVLKTFEDLEGEQEKYLESELEEDPGLMERLIATGNTEVSSKKIKRKRVRKFIRSGEEILEDHGYIAGENIPIIPCYGHRVFVDNIERCRGQVRKAKDSQRLGNMQKSKLAEISAYSPVEKPIFYPKEINGHVDDWRDINLKDSPFMLKNPIYDNAGNLVQIAREYTRSPQIPPALAALIQSTEADTSDILGNQEKGDKIVSNISGKAVQMVQKRLDYQSFIYLSNFAKSKKRAAEVWLSMAKELYVEQGRRMQGIGERGDTQYFNLMQPDFSGDGKTMLKNNFCDSKLKVVVEIGPSSESKRASMVEDLTAILSITSDPQNKQVIEAMIMMNLEGEGMQQIREYYRKKLVRMGALKPNEEDLKEMQSEQPDANTKYLEAEALKSASLAKKAEADTALSLARAKETEAKTRETKVDTLKTLSEIDNNPENP